MTTICKYFINKWHCVHFERQSTPPESYPRPLPTVHTVELVVETRLKERGRGEALSQSAIGSMRLGLWQLN